MSPKRCPECDAECRSAQRFCTLCGADLRAGVASRHPPPPEQEATGPLGPLLWFLNLFPGLVSPKVIFMSAAAVIVAAFVAWLAFCLFLLGGWIVALFIGGFAVMFMMSIICDFRLFSSI